MEEYDLDDENDFEEIRCCTCNCVFALEENHLNHLRKSHQSFYCPNGHCQSFKKSEKEISLEEQLAKEKSLHEQTKAELEEIKGKRKNNFTHNLGIKF